MYSSGKWHEIIIVLITSAINIDRSKDFRPLYGALRELRSFVPSCAPMLATTATVTSVMREDIIRMLDMDGCCLVSESPDKQNITYEAVRKNTIEEDFSSVVRDLAERNIKARRVVVYCQSLDMCVSLYAHFLQDASYYPPGVEQVSDNLLFEMFHSCTGKHNKRVVMSSLSQHHMYR